MLQTKKVFKSKNELSSFQDNPQKSLIKILHIFGFKWPYFCQILCGEPLHQVLASYSTVESMPPQMTNTHDSFTSQTFTLERVVVKLAVIILILNPVTVQYVLLW